MARHASLSSFLGALVVSTLGAGCSGNAHTYAQHVTPAGDGQFFVTGSNGFAAFADGERMVRMDYPKKWSASRYAYRGDAVGPAAQVVMLNEQAWLFTRNGEVYRHEDGDWEDAEVKFPEVALDADENLHVRVVSAGADGRLLLLSEDQRLLMWTDAAGLAVNHFDVERGPATAGWMGFVDERLLAIDYAEGWVVRERVSPGLWQIRGHVDPGSGYGSPMGVVKVPDGPLMVVYPQELVDVDEGRPIPLGGLLLGPAPTPGPPVASRTLDPDFAAPPGAEGMITATATSYGPDVRVSVTGIVDVGDGAPVLAIRGEAEGLVELANDKPRFMHCPLLGDRVAGAIRIEGGLRVVNGDAALVDVRAEGGCALASRPLLERD